MEIPEIRINDVGIEISEVRIRELNIPQINSVFNTTSSSPSLPPEPPVVVDIGLPIVDIPGCVEAHEQDDGKNQNLVDDDPKGTVTFCDGGIPNFNPIQYEPDQILKTPTPKVDTRQPKQPKAPEVKSPETPKTPAATADIECPTKEQLRDEPVGFIFDSGRKKIIGYKLEGIECKRIVEDVPIPAQIINAIPPASTVTTTASIAVVATTSALLAKPFADILLRVVKPVTKKVIKKIASIRGKEVKVLSVSERRIEQRDRNSAIMALRKALKPK